MTKIEVIKEIIRFGNCLSIIDLKCANCPLDNPDDAPDYVCMYYSSKQKAEKYYLNYLLDKLMK